KKPLGAFTAKRLQFSQHLNGFFVCFRATLFELSSESNAGFLTGNTRLLFFDKALLSGKCFYLQRKIESGKASIA
ncbi:MAG: hypothetical protein KDD28_33835, partial [Phaeodactylibacter sp.]|nr:hypothetical protein [Phaeodactylibacter sp.]